MKKKINLFFILLLLMAPMFLAAQVSQPSGFQRENIMSYLKRNAYQGDDLWPVVAHRGYWRGSTLNISGNWYPENSLGSIIRAYQYGIEAVEMDVRVSKDGVPFIMHDKTIGRTTNAAFDPITNTGASPEVAQLTSAQLKTYYLSAWDYNNNKKVLTTEHIPTLEDCINKIKLASLQVVLVIDVFNATDIEAAYKVVKKNNALGFTIFKLGAGGGAGIGDYKVLFKKLGFLNRYGYVTSTLKAVNFAVILYEDSSPETKNILTFLKDKVRKSLVFVDLIYRNNYVDPVKSPVLYNYTLSLTNKGVRMGHYLTVPSAYVKDSSGLWRNAYFTGGGKGVNIQGSAKKLQPGGCCVITPENTFQENISRLIRPFIKATIGGNVGAKNGANVTVITSDNVEDAKNKFVADSKRNTNLYICGKANCLVKAGLSATTENQTNTYPCSMEQLPGRAIKIAANNDDMAVINQDGSVFTWDFNANNWHYTGIGGQKEVAVGGGKVWVINTGNQLYQISGADGFKNMNVLLKKVTLNANGDAAGIGTDNNIYRYDNTNQGWYPVGGNASEITLDTDGNIFVTNPANEIWKGTTSGWQKLPGLGKKITSDITGDVFLIGTDNLIYRWNEEIQNWNYLTTIQSGLKEIAAPSGNTLAGTDANGNVFRSNCPIDYGDYSLTDYLSCFQPLCGGAGYKVAADGDRAVVIGTDRALWKTESNGCWSRLDGTYALDVALDNNDGAIWHIGADNSIFKQNVATGGNWVRVGTGALAKKIAIGGIGDGKKVAIIGMDNSIWVYNEAANGFTKMAGTYATEIAVDASGQIWHIGGGNGIYAQTDDFWRGVGGTARKITTSLDGAVCILGTDGNVYNYVGGTVNSWRLTAALQNDFTEIALNSSSSIIGIKTNQQIWSIKADCNADLFTSDLVLNTVANVANTGKSGNMGQDMKEQHSIADTIIANLKKSITIFPNPAHDKITVQLPAGMEKATVTIINALGITITTDNNTGLQRIISIEGKPRGMYLVRVTNNDGVSSTQKLIVQ